MPTKELQSVFRKFKTWLVALYKDVLQLGGLPPKAVQDVMSRMLATEEQIESWSAEQSLTQFEEGKFFGGLNQREQAKLFEFVDRIKEGTKENVTKAFMEELSHKR